MNAEELAEVFRDANEDDRHYLAWALLREKCPTAERRFNRLTKGLAQLLKDVQEEFPEACFYTGSGGLNLLVGPSHDKKDERHPEYVALSASAYLRIGDGDF